MCLDFLLNSLQFFHNLIFRYILLINGGNKTTELKNKFLLLDSIQFFFNSYANILFKSYSISGTARSV